ncbi:MAG: EF-P beta-lysylation protein EpmB [Chromatiales bacterium]|nr:EF-P beta-lysylation protein EpmB [Chromatiales bacterium]
MNRPIIPRSPLRKNGKNNNGSFIRDITALCEQLQLPNSVKDAAIGLNSPFPLRISKSFLEQIERGNPNDPLLLQVLPQTLENSKVEGFSDDPVGDLSNSVTPGVIHKYRNRVLLTVTGACAIHCRYCFRRNFPYNSENPKRDNWDSAINYIHQHSEIEEVILSGGDPLMLELENLSELVQQIEQIHHIKRLRIHSRIPIVAPERVNEQMLTWFDKVSLPVVMVLHSNHPNELSTEVESVLNRLSQRGVRLLNQSVLLKGVNDSAETLAKLSNRLFDIGVQPYYLNLLDRAHGSAHFEVSAKHTQEIAAALQTLLPGYLMPKIVRDQGKSSGKVVLCLESL